MLKRKSVVVAILNSSFGKDMRENLFAKIAGVLIWAKIFKNQLLRR